MDALLAIGFGGAAGGIAAKVAFLNWYPEAICASDDAVKLPQNFPTLTQTITSTSTHISKSVTTIMTPAVTILTKWRTETSIQPVWSTLTKAGADVINKTVTETTTETLLLTLSDTITETSLQTLWETLTSTDTSTQTFHHYATAVTEPKVETITTTKIKNNYIDRPRAAAFTVTEWSTSTDTTTATTTQTIKLTEAGRELRKARSQNADQLKKIPNMASPQDIEATVPGNDEAWRDIAVQLVRDIAFTVLAIVFSAYLFRLYARAGEKAPNAAGNEDGKGGGDDDVDDGDDDGHNLPVNQAIQYQEKHTQTDAGQCTSSTCTLPFCTSHSEYQSERRAFQEEVCIAFVSHHGTHPIAWVDRNIRRLREIFQGVTDCLDREALATKICDVLEREAESRLTRGLTLPSCGRNADQINKLQKSLANRVRTFRAESINPKLLASPGTFVRSFELSRFEKLARDAEDDLAAAFTGQCASEKPMLTPASPKSVVESNREASSVQFSTPAFAAGDSVKSSIPPRNLVTGSNESDDIRAASRPDPRQISEAFVPSQAPPSKIPKSPTHPPPSADRLPPSRSSSALSTLSSTDQSASSLVILPVTRRRSGNFSQGNLRRFSISPPKRPSPSPEETDVPVTPEFPLEPKTVPLTQVVAIRAGEDDGQVEAVETSSNSEPHDTIHAIPPQQVSSGSSAEPSAEPSVKPPSPGVGKDSWQPVQTPPPSEGDADDNDSLFSGYVAGFTPPAQASEISTHESGSRSEGDADDNDSLFSGYVAGFTPPPQTPELSTNESGRPSSAATAPNEVILSPTTPGTDELGLGIETPALQLHALIEDVGVAQTPPTTTALPSAVRSTQHAITSNEFSLDMDSDRWPSFFGACGYHYSEPGAAHLRDVCFPDGAEAVDNSAETDVNLVVAAIDSLAHQRPDLPSVTIADFLKDFDSQGYEKVRNARSSYTRDELLADLIFLFGLKHKLRLSLGVVERMDGNSTEANRIISPMARTSPGQADLVIWVVKTAKPGLSDHWCGLRRKSAADSVAAGSNVVGAFKSDTISTNYAPTHGQAGAPTQPTIDPMPSPKPTPNKDQQDHVPQAAPTDNTIPPETLADAMISLLPGTFAQQRVGDQAKELFLDRFHQGKCGTIPTSTEFYLCALDAATKSLAAQQSSLPQINTLELLQVFNSPVYQSVRMSRRQKNVDFLEDEQIADLIYWFGARHDLHLSTGVVSRRSDRPLDRTFTILTPHGDNAPPMDPHHVVWVLHDVYVVEDKEQLQKDDTRISHLMDVDWEDLGLAGPRKILGISHWSGLRPLGPFERSCFAGTDAVEVPVERVVSSENAAMSTSVVSAHSHDIGTGTGHVSGMDGHSQQRQPQPQQTQQQQQQPYNIEQQQYHDRVPFATSHLNAQHQIPRQLPQNVQQRALHLPPALSHQQSLTTAAQTESGMVSADVSPGSFENILGPNDVDMTGVSDIADNHPEICLNPNSDANGSNFGLSNATQPNFIQGNAIEVPIQAIPHNEAQMDVNMQSADGDAQENIDSPFPHGAPEFPLPDFFKLSLSDAPNIGVGPVDPLLVGGSFDDDAIQSVLTDHGRRRHREAEDNATGRSIMNVYFEAQDTDAMDISAVSDAEPRKHDEIDISALTIEDDAPNTDQTPIATEGMDSSPQSHLEHRGFEPDHDPMIYENVDPQPSWSPQPKRQQQPVRQSSLRPDIPSHISNAPQTSQGAASELPPTPVDLYMRSFQGIAPVYVPTIVPTCTKSAMPLQAPPRQQEELASDGVAFPSSPTWLTPSIPSNASPPQIQGLALSDDTGGLPQPVVKPAGPLRDTAMPSHIVFPDDNDSSDESSESDESDLGIMEPDEEANDRFRLKLDDLQDRLSTCRILSTKMGVEEVKMDLSLLQRHLSRAMDLSEGENFNCAVFEPRVAWLDRRLRVPYAKLMILDGICRSKQLEKANRDDDDAKDLSDRFDLIYEHMVDWNTDLESLQMAQTYEEEIRLRREVDSKAYLVEDELEEALADLDELEEPDVEQAVDAYVDALEDKSEEELTLEREAEENTMKMDSTMTDPSRRSPRHRLNYVMRMMDTNQKAAIEEAEKQSAEMMDYGDDAFATSRRDARKKSCEVAAWTSDARRDVNSVFGGGEEMEKEDEDMSDASTVQLGNEDEASCSKPVDVEMAGGGEELELDAFELLVQEDENSHLGR